MHKPWLENYPEGMPAQIDSGGFVSLVDLLDQACKKYVNRVACIAFDVPMTYGQLDAHALAFAKWLQSLDLPRGFRLALMMPNVPAYMIVLLGTLRAGGVLVNVNPLYTSRELQLQLKDSEASVIVVFESFAHVLQKTEGCDALHYRVVVSPGEMLGALKGNLVNFVARYVKKIVPSWDLPGAIKWKDVLNGAQKLSWRPPKLGLQDLAVLQYTGGTTGIPKGAMLTHGNLVANVLQIHQVALPALRNVMANPLTMLAALPLYHVFAMTVCALYGMYAGMKNLLVINPRDRKAIIQIWRKHPVNIFPGVNTLFNSLAREPAFTELDFSSLKLAFGGGMALQSVVADQWIAVTGKPLIEGYGLSECSPVVAANPTDAKAFSGNVGLPLPSTEIAILNEQGDVVEMGVHGEIAVRGPQVMSGYWQASSETAQGLRPDGFFLTGDIGWMNAQGFVYIADRKNDLIVVSGFNVYPSEIEAVVAAHAGVLECAAIGIPDTHSGELVKLFVVKKYPDLSEHALREWCSEQLARYKCPRTIVFCEDLPKSNVGKVLRRSLRQHG